MSDDIRIPESEASFHRCNAETLRGINEIRAIADRVRAERKEKANASDLTDVSKHSIPTPDDCNRTFGSGSDPDPDSMLLWGALTPFQQYRQCEPAPRPSSVWKVEILCNAAESGEAALID